MGVEFRRLKVRGLYGGVEWVERNGIFGGWSGIAKVRYNIWWMEYNVI